MRGAGVTRCPFGVGMINEPGSLLSATHKNELKIGTRPQGKIIKFTDKEIDHFCNFEGGQAFLAGK